MSAIDLSKSLVGELFPVIKEAETIGRLGFFYSQPGDPASLQFRQADGTPFSYPCTTGNNPTASYKWRITPLNNGKVLISCTHPLTGKNQLAYASRADGDEILIEEREIPGSIEAVKPENQFEVTYIEGSPLFFTFKAPNQRYFTAGTVANIKFFNRNYYQVGSIYTEEQRRNPDLVNYCSWYLEPDETKMGHNAFQGFTNIKPFTQLSRTLGTHIDDAFLNRLTRKTW